MRILRTEDYQSMSEQAAALLAAQVITKPDSVLGLATGATAVGAYWKLCEWQRSGRLSLAQARTVNTDEYLNLLASHEQSHKRFMENYLLEKVNIPQENQAALEYPGGVPPLRPPSRRPGRHGHRSFGPRQKRPHRLQ